MKKFILTTFALASSLTFFGQNTFPDSGNVGIGTTEPNVDFHISSNRLSSDAYPPNESHFKPVNYDLIHLENLGSSVIGPSIFLKGYNASVGNSFSGRIVLLESGSAKADIAFLTSRPSDFKQHEAMRVTSSGFLGIGTSNPDSRLTVKGKIHCEEVQVDLQVPADYVFEKYYTGVSELKEDYTMPTLTEVEAYTKENHHLPNIPSATEIKEEGLYLKDMTNLLLQKIEELTLYTIEQEKRIKALEEGKLVTKK